MSFKEKLAKNIIKHIVGGQSQKETVTTQTSVPEVSEINTHPQNTSAPATIKKKKNKYNIPPGLTKKEAKILKTVTKRANFYDANFCNCCCCKIGLEPVLGLIPVIGDFAGVFLALMLINTAKEADLPKSLVSRMIVNVWIDFMLGLIPMVGDIADFFYKCNMRNAILLHDYLADRARNRSLVLEEGSVEIIERNLPPGETEAFNARVNH